MLAKVTLRSKVGKEYLKVQGSQKLPKDQSLPKGPNGPQLAKLTKKSKGGKVYLKV